MDLSPGTRTTPVSAAQGEARQGWAAEAGWEAVEEGEDGPVMKRLDWNSGVEQGGSGGPGARLRHSLRGPGGPGRVQPPVRPGAGPGKCLVKFSFDSPE